MASKLKRSMVLATIIFWVTVFLTAFAGTYLPNDGPVHPKMMLGAMCPMAAIFVMVSRKKLDGGTLLIHGFLIVLAAAMAILMQTPFGDRFSPWTMTVTPVILGVAATLSMTQSAVKE